MDSPTSTLRSNISNPFSAGWWCWTFKHESAYQPRSQWREIWFQARKVWNFCNRSFEKRSTKRPTRFIHGRGYSSLLALATVSFLIFRKRQPYLVDHLVSAMHFYSFQLLASIGISPLILWNIGFSMLLLSFTCIYLLIQQLRLFPESKAISILKSIFLFLAFVAVENVFVLLLSGIIAVRLLTAH